MARVVIWNNKKRVLPEVRSVIGDLISGYTSGPILPPLKPFVAVKPKVLWLTESNNFESIVTVYSNSDWKAK